MDIALMVKDVILFIRRSNIKLKILILMNNLLLLLVKIRRLQDYLI